MGMDLVACEVQTGFWKVASLCCASEG